METLKIEGMHCKNCSSSVEKTLAAIDGISNVAVDLDKKEAAFDNNGVERQTLKDAIESIGFDVVD